MWWATRFWTSSVCFVFLILSQTPLHRPDVLDALVWLQDFQQMSLPNALRLVQCSFLVPNPKKRKKNVLRLTSCGWLLLCSGDSLAIFISLWSSWNFFFEDSRNHASVIGQIRSWRSQVLNYQYSLPKVEFSAVSVEIGISPYALCSTGEPAWWHSVLFDVRVLCLHSTFSQIFAEIE